MDTPDSLPLILASASPRRSELLTSAGFRFSVEAADVDESPLDGENPEAYVLRVARDKARVVAARCRKSGEIVLAADTTVALDGEILAKPENDLDAIRMLKLLSGRVHDVFTGVVVLAGDREAAEVVPTRVRLLPINMDEILWYVSSGEPIGKAGAYGIQGRAARFVDWIEGSWSNVVGLPVSTVYRLLKDLGA
ncbi:MAG TPA: Maf family protein [Vicinamibacterales bacterium]|nr:Maf family protein [Vicinamibacterales bacterium]